MSVSTFTAPPLLSPQRLAVSLMFLANGFVVGSWAPKIPEFAKRLSLDESTLGLMIMCFGIGSLCTMPVVGALISRNGSHRVMRLVAAVTIPCLMLVTVAPSIWTAAAALFLVGGLIGGMDVAMNANAVEVEKRQGRAIMSSCHGFWSLGGVVSAKPRRRSDSTLWCLCACHRRICNHRRCNYHRLAKGVSRSSAQGGKRAWQYRHTSPAPQPA